MFYANPSIKRADFKILISLQKAPFKNILPIDVTDPPCNEERLFAPTVHVCASQFGSAHWGINIIISRVDEKMSNQ